MLCVLLKNGPILSHIFHFLIIFPSYKKKFNSILKKLNGKLFINCNGIWVLISSQEPNDVKFLAVYMDIVRQALWL